MKSHRSLGQAMKMQPHKVFFDDKCSLCSKEIAHYKSLRHIQQIDWIPISSSAEILKRYGLSTETVMQRIHAVRSDGVLISGASVFALIWTSVRPYHLLGKFVLRCNLVPVLDFFYRYFAKWRYKRNAQCELV